MEFPYISLDGQDTFDLELERFIKNKDKEGCVQFIRSILQGHAHKDKYGDVIQLQTAIEITKFKKQLLNNYQFNKICQSLGISTHKLLLLPKGGFKEFHETSMTAGSGGAFGDFGGQYAAGDARVPKMIMPLQRRFKLKRKRKKK